MTDLTEATRTNSMINRQVTLKNYTKSNIVSICDSEAWKKKKRSWRKNIKYISKWGNGIKNNNYLMYLNRNFTWGDGIFWLQNEKHSIHWSRKCDVLQKVKGEETINFNFLKQVDLICKTQKNTPHYIFNKYFYFL